jgi:hypothetical protein
MPFEPPEEFAMDDGPAFVGALFGVKIGPVMVMVNPRLLDDAANVRV